MLLFPLHQSLGQINIIMLLASGRTKMYLIFNTITMGVSIPVTYLVLAPGTAMVSGFGLGALGMVLKMVGLQLIMVNVVSWWLANIYGWQLDWKYQWIILGSVLFVGWVSYELASWIGVIMGMGLIAKGSDCFFVYGTVVGLLVWFFPRFAGLTQQEIKVHTANLLKIVT